MPLKDFTGNPPAAQLAGEPDGARPGENTRRHKESLSFLRRARTEHGRKQPSRDNTTGFYLRSLFFPINHSRFLFVFLTNRKFVRDTDRPILRSYLFFFFTTRGGFASAREEEKKKKNLFLLKFIL